MKELDQVLARDSIEGITRYRHGIKSREYRRQSNIQFQIPDIPDNGVFGGMVFSGLDGTTNLLQIPFPQFHVWNYVHKRFDTYSEEQIPGLKLSEFIYGRLSERKYKIHAPDETAFNRVVSLLAANDIDYNSHRQASADVLRENGKLDDKLEVNVQWSITKTIIRSLAKIVFNYAVRYLGFNEMMKPIWDQARRFIRYGENSLSVSISDKPFWNAIETQYVRYTDDGINIRIQNYYNSVIGVIQFYNLHTYYIVLANNYNIRDELEIGHRFTSGEKPSGGFRTRLVVPGKHGTDEIIASSKQLS